jgi:hypothetical protein
MTARDDQHAGGDLLITAATLSRSRAPAQPQQQPPTPPGADGSSVGVSVPGRSLPSPLWLARRPARQLAYGDPAPSHTGRMAAAPT